MKNYIISDHLLLRRPQGSGKIYHQDTSWFLKNDDFMAALLVASPVFYRQVLSRFRDGQPLSDKEMQSLRKYINRYCYRPIPFGLFASVSAGRWGIPEPVKMGTERYETLILPDEIILERIQQERPPLNNDTDAWEINPTLYQNLDEYRFIRSEVSLMSGKRDYLLQGIPGNETLSALIPEVTAGRSRNDLVKNVRRTTGCTAAEARQYLDFLIEAQVILPVERKTITGPLHLFDTGTAFFRSLSRPQPSRPAALKIAGKLPVVKEIAGLLKAVGEMSDLNGQPEGKLLNVVLHGPAAGASLPFKYQDVLNQAMECLATVCLNGRSGDMSGFAVSFRSRFEDREIPLLQAVDPETGIGYGEDPSSPGNPLLRTVALHDVAETGTHIRWDKIRAELLKCWHAYPVLPGGRPEIRLTPEILSAMRQGEDPATEQLLGISVLFRVSGEHVMIDSAGGINAVALAGRFTAGNEAIRSAARELARKLEQDNPGIIFAEILHLGDPQTDNINRREALYAYEIPLTAAAAVAKENQLALSDLRVSVRNGTVLLRSIRHDRMVIPRLSSAYNYHLNKLPLFRFLAGLSYQYGRSNFSLELRDHFPGLAFYPRVSYRQAILYPATWVLGPAELSKLAGSTAESLIERLAGIPGIPTIPGRFLFTEGDQQLRLDLAYATDLALFLSLIRGKQEVVLQEVFGNAPLSDDNANVQYNAFLLPSGPLKLPVQLPLPVSDTAETRRFLPGSQWLYLKIYTARTSVNRMLVRLLPLLHQRYPSGRVRKWFFVRYEDTGDHLRLRLLISPADTGDVLAAFRSQVEGSVEQHLIREYQVNSYSRELERYNGPAYGRTENHFYRSSELVAVFIARHEQYGGLKTMMFAVYTTYNCLLNYISAPVFLAQFLEAAYRQFLPEFEGTGFLPQLDLRYREYRSLFDEVLNDPKYMASLRLQKRYQDFIGSFARLTEGAAVNPNADHLVRSLLHMHLNRIFPVEGRKQEMLVFYLLFKWQVSRNSRVKRSGSGGPV